MTIEKSELAAKPLKMTYEEYLAWEHESAFTEWEDGEVICLMPVKNHHQVVQEFLLYLIKTFVRFFRLGVVRTAPLEVKIKPDGNAREPDIIFIANEQLERLTADRVNGAPDLIIEIISDESVSRDRVKKFDEYEAGGVPEYWIIDNRPNRKRTQFYQLDEHGEYQAIKPDAKGIYHSRVLPGFWLKVSWLWDESPDEFRALAALIGPERMAQALREAAEDQT